MKKIALFVVSIHLSLLFSMILFHAASPVKQPQKKHIVAKTVKLNPSKPALKKNLPEPHKPQAKPLPKPQMQSIPVPKPEPQKPKEVPTKRPPVVEKKKSPASKPAEKPKAIPKKPAVPDQLLKELEESISKIDDKRDKLRTKKKVELSIPVAEIQSQSDSVYQTDESDGEFREALVAFLRETLHLPDYGEVTIKLTLLHDGKVRNLIVLKAESPKNRRYLEEKLPKLAFPSSNNAEELTLVVTFCNEY